MRELSLEEIDSIDGGALGLFGTITAGVAVMVIGHAAVGAYDSWQSQRASDARNNAIREREQRRDDEARR